MSVTLPVGTEVLITAGGYLHGCDGVVTEPLFYSVRSAARVSGRIPVKVRDPSCFAMLPPEQIVAVFDGP